MNNNVQVKETANPPLNIVLWAVSVAIVIAAVYGNSYFGGESLLYRVLGLLAASVVAALIAFQTVQGKAFWLLLKGARTCLLYTSPSPRDKRQSRMPSSA